MNFFCKLGFHKWEKWEIDTSKFIDSNKIYTEIKRICKRCKLTNYKLTYHN